MEEVVGSIPTRSTSYFQLFRGFAPKPFARKLQKLTARRYLLFLFLSFLSAPALYRGTLFLDKGSGIYFAFRSLRRRRHWLLRSRSFGARGHQLIVNRVDRPTHLLLQRLDIGDDWIRHFIAGGACLCVSGLMRLMEHFIAAGTSGVV
jgi:hypothetical protein